MRIINKTEWNTSELRRVFAKVLAKWNTIDRKVNTKRLEITVVNARWRGVSGCAYLGIGVMRLRLPKPGEAWFRTTPLTELDPREVGWIFEHELAHCAGYDHDRMGPLNHWEIIKSGRYDFISNLKIGLKRARPPKPKLPIKEIRYQKALDTLARWESKLKRATTAVKKARAKVRYYERNK